MQDLISHCLQYESRERPTAQNVFDRLCTAEFVGLKRAIPVERDHSVETFTIRVRREPVSFRDQMCIQVLFHTHPQYDGCLDTDIVLISVAHWISLVSFPHSFPAGNEARISYRCFNHSCMSLSTD